MKEGGVFSLQLQFQMLDLIQSSMTPLSALGSGKGGAQFKVYMLISSNMALVTAANQLKSMAVKRFTGQQDGLLYLHQREMAVVSSCDPCVRTLGSDGATSCLVLVLRRISNGDTCMLKYDGCGAGAFIKTCIERMLRQSPLQPLSRQSRLGLQLDAHLVGGFQDPALETMRLTGDLLLAMQSSPFEFHLRTACVAHVNSRVIDDTAYPIIQGVAFCVRRARLTPAEFEDRGPWAALRGARFLSSQSGPACVYDSGLPQRLVIEPFSYRQPQAGGLSLDFLISMPDDKLVKSSMWSDMDSVTPTRMTHMASSTKATAMTTLAIRFCLAVGGLSSESITTVGGSGVSSSSPSDPSPSLPLLPPFSSSSGEMGASSTPRLSLVSRSVLCDVAAFPSPLPPPPPPLVLDCIGSVSVVLVANLLKANLLAGENEATGTVGHFMIRRAPGPVKRAPRFEEFSSTGISRIASGSVHQRGGAVRVSEDFGSMRAEGVTRAGLLPEALILLSRVISFLLLLQRSAEGCKRRSSSSSRQVLRDSCGIIIFRPAPARRLSCDSESMKRRTLPPASCSMRSRSSAIRRRRSVSVSRRAVSGGSVEAPRQLGATAVAGRAAVRCVDQAAPPAVAPLTAPAAGGSSGRKSRPVRRAADRSSSSSSSSSSSLSEVACAGCGARVLAVRSPRERPSLRSAARISRAELKPPPTPAPQVQAEAGSRSRPALSSLASSARSSGRRSVFRHLAAYLLSASSLSTVCCNSRRSLALARLAATSATVNPRRSCIAPPACMRKSRSSLWGKKGNSKADGDASNDSAGCSESKRTAAAGAAADGQPGRDKLPQLVRQRRMTLATNALLRARIDAAFAAAQLRRNFQELRSRTSRAEVELLELQPVRANVGEHRDRLAEQREQLSSALESLSGMQAELKRLSSLVLTPGALQLEHQRETQRRIREKRAQRLRPLNVVLTSADKFDYKYFLSIRMLSKPGIQTAEKLSGKAGMASTASTGNPGGASSGQQQQKPQQKPRPQLQHRTSSLSKAGTNGKLLPAISSSGEGGAAADGERAPQENSKNGGGRPPAEIYNPFVNRRLVAIERHVGGLGKATDAVRAEAAKAAKVTARLEKIDSEIPDARLRLARLAKLDGKQTEAKPGAKPEDKPEVQSEANTADKPDAEQLSQFISRLSAAEAATRLLSERLTALADLATSPGKLEMEQQNLLFGSTTFASRRLPARRLQAAIGKRRLANVGWQTSAGKRRLANVGWQTSADKRRLANGLANVPLANVGWQTSAGKRPADKRRLANGLANGLANVPLANVGWQTSRRQTSRRKTSAGKRQLANVPQANVGRQTSAGKRRLAIVPLANVGWQTPRRQMSADKRPAGKHFVPPLGAHELQAGHRRLRLRVENRRKMEASGRRARHLSAAAVAVATNAVGNAASTAATAARCSGCGRGHRRSVQGRLLHVGPRGTDAVRLVQDALVHGVVVVECDKAEAATLASFLPGHDLGLFHVAELAKVVAQVFRGHILLQRANEELLDGHVRLRLVRIFARHRPLRLHLLAAQHMRPGSLRGVHHLGLAVGDKAEPARPASLVVLHHHDVRDFAEVGEEFVQLVVADERRQAADEELSKLLRSATLFVHLLEADRGAAGATAGATDGPGRAASAASASAATPAAGCTAAAARPSFLSSFILLAYTDVSSSSTVDSSTTDEPAELIDTAPPGLLRTAAPMNQGSPRPSRMSNTLLPTLLDTAMSPKPASKCSTNTLARASGTEVPAASMDAVQQSQEEHLPPAAGLRQSGMVAMNSSVHGNVAHQYARWSHPLGNSSGDSSTSVICTAVAAAADGEDEQPSSSGLITSEDELPAAKSESSSSSACSSSVETPVFPLIAERLAAGGPKSCKLTSPEAAAGPPRCDPLLLAAVALAAGPPALRSRWLPPVARLGQRSAIHWSMLSLKYMMTMYMAYSMRRAAASYLVTAKRPHRLTMNSRLNTALPTMVLTPTSLCVRNTPMTEVNSSGAELPAAMKRRHKIVVADDGEAGKQPQCGEAVQRHGAAPLVSQAEQIGREVLDGAGCAGVARGQLRQAEQVATAQRGGGFETAIASFARPSIAMATANQPVTPTDATVATAVAAAVRHLRCRRPLQRFHKVVQLVEERQPQALFQQPVKRLRRLTLHLEQEEQMPALQLEGLEVAGQLVLQQPVQHLLAGPLRVGGFRRRPRLRRSRRLHRLSHRRNGLIRRLEHTLLQTHMSTAAEPSTALAMQSSVESCICSKSTHTLGCGGGGFAADDPVGGGAEGGGGGAGGRSVDWPSWRFCLTDRCLGNGTSRRSPRSSVHKRKLRSSGPQISLIFDEQAELKDIDKMIFSAMETSSLRSGGDCSMSDSTGRILHSSRMSLLSSFFRFLVNEQPAGFLLVAAEDQHQVGGEAESITAGFQIRLGGVNKVIVDQVEEDLAVALEQHGQGELLTLVRVVLAQSHHVGHQVERLLLDGAVRASWQSLSIRPSASTTATAFCSRSSTISASLRREDLITWLRNFAVSVSPSTRYCWTLLMESRFRLRVFRFSDSRLACGSASASASAFDVCSGLSTSSASESDMMPSVVVVRAWFMAADGGFSLNQPEPIESSPRSLQTGAHAAAAAGVAQAGGAAVIRIPGLQIGAVDEAADAAAQQVAGPAGSG
uniref:Protein kinase domain-containing protein n=1 Tax=Macrostomum lignano TaxID=282301 RepID=A0A1I8HZB6_9PLAT